MAWIKLILTIAAAAVIALLWSKIERQSTELGALHSQLQLAQQTNQQRLAAIKEMEAREDKMALDLRSVVRATTQPAARKAPVAPAAAANPGSAASAGKGFGSMMESMMNDPDMLKAIAQQQAAMLKTQYAPLMKQLNLTPDQRDAFFKLLSDNMTNAMVQGMAMMSGTNNPDAASAAAVMQKNMQEQIRALLGDSGYTQYQDFQTSLADRMMLDQMKSDFADNPLTDDQQQRLLQLMMTERKNSALAVDPNTGQPALATSKSPAALQQAMDAQDQISQRVYQQAASFLSPAQLESLGNSQTNFHNLTKMSLTLVRKMMGTNMFNEPDDEPDAP
jgi:hypothetical protein